MTYKKDTIFQNVNVIIYLREKINSVISDFWGWTTYLYYALIFKFLGKLTWNLVDVRISEMRLFWKVIILVKMSGVYKNVKY